MTLELADGEYLRAKEEARRNGFPHAITVSTIEKRLGLKPRSLANYRGYHYSRKAKQ